MSTKIMLCIHIHTCACTNISSSLWWASQFSRSHNHIACYAGTTGVSESGSLGGWGLMISRVLQMLKVWEQGFVKQRELCPSKIPLCSVTIWIHVIFRDFYTHTHCVWILRDTFVNVGALYTSIYKILRRVPGSGLSTRMQVPPLLKSILLSDTVSFSKLSSSYLLPLMYLWISAFPPSQKTYNAISLALFLLRSLSF